MNSVCIVLDNLIGENIHVLVLDPDPEGPLVFDGRLQKESRREIVIPDRYF